MSWFDAAGFATIAKTALKEAQRTIDKALDIKEESTKSNTPVVDTNSDDFFGAWGLPQSGQNKVSDTSTELVTTPGKLTNTSTSLWGSFTGSFFEPPQDKLPQCLSIDSLDDSPDFSVEGFSKSKLVVQHSDDGESGFLSRLPSVENEEYNLDPNIIKKTENKPNRLSVISSDGKTSSESVEVVSGGTDCTTSPDTDLSLKTSESVEVLADSLTSPSSIEVLLTGTENTDEYVSPLVSPEEEEVSHNSVEVIAEDQDEDSVSFASVSDSTSITLQEANLIVKQPSRTNLLHLSLTPLIDTQLLGSRENITSVIDFSNIIDIPNTTGIQADDDGSQSDRTIIASDNVMESSSDTSTTTESFYLKNVIADAMTEKLSIKVTADVPPRETSSPISSESRSDLVKIGSGHTSGDENETTTSSDIEIISSPNGDSSSTQSRQSPAKLGFKQKSVDLPADMIGKMAFKKIKGHNRELSETSSISIDDSHSSEIDRLLKRVAEMTEILEMRETKLIELSRHNAEIQEVNDELQHQLNIFLTKQMESPDLSQVTEEYTQRLSVLEKKFQQAIREKDNIKKQLEQAKHEASTRLSKTEFDAIITEKQETIVELREEGEKLSKQQLQQSNIIKKLRAREKEQDNIIKSLRENVEDLTLETERLKRSLIAKEEVECSQIEAVHKLTSRNKKLELDVTQLQSQVDDTTQKYDTTRKSLEAAKKELIDKDKTSSELHAREHMLQTLENEKRIIDSQNEEIVGQLENLRLKLQQDESEYVKKQQGLRMENSELLKRLESAERRNEELSQSITDISKPLIRQLDSLQVTHNTKLATFEKVEQDLLAKIGKMQHKLQSSSEAEILLREECLTMRSKISTFESQVASAQHQNQILQVDVEQAKTAKSLSEQELRHEIENLKQQLNVEKADMKNLSNKLKALEQQLSIEKVALEAEKRKSFLQEQVRDRNDSLPIMDQASPPLTRNTSPTLSLGHLSIPESLGSSVWLTDEQQFDFPAPRFTNIVELQMLQTNLKQREGEVQQLQWELNRREQEKNMLNSEISELVKRVDQLQVQSVDFQALKNRFEEVQQQYETMCQLYGEKVEETEELKLDLVDVKELYKAQLDELLKYKNAI